MAGMAGAQGADLLRRSVIVCHSQVEDTQWPKPRENLLLNHGESSEGVAGRRCWRACCGWSLCYEADLPEAYGDAS